jgi:hypothetical protein
MENSDLSQANLPKVPCAYSFLVCDLFQVEHWVVEEYNKLRSAKHPFDRVLAVAQLTQLCKPNPDTNIPTAALEMSRGLGPNRLAIIWLKNELAQNPDLLEAVTIDWGHRATKLMTAFPGFSDFVAGEEDQDKLWEAGVKLLHARDNLQRVANLMREVSDFPWTWTKMLQDLDNECICHNGVWSLIDARDDRRLRSAVLDNSMSDEVIWWTLPLSEVSPEMEQPVYLDAHDPILFDDETNHHLWIGMFAPDGTLRDNFMLYHNEIPENCKPTPAFVLQTVHLIEEKNLSNGGHQILKANIEGEIYSFASAKPFQVGDTFAIIGGEEHQELAGDAEHFAELAQILRLKAEARIEAAREAEICTRQAIESNQEIASMMREDSTDQENIRIYPPAIDIFIDLKSDPEWIKEYVASAFESYAPYSIATVVGFLARTGTELIRERAKTWASTLTQKQLNHITQECIRRLTELPNIATQLKSQADKDIRSDMALHILLERDEIESCLWILEAADQSVDFTTETVDSILLECDPLFQTKVDTDANRFNKTLSLVRETCPACWWVARANLG